MSSQEKLIREIVNNNLCSGCGTCAGVCAKHCITFDCANDYTPVLDPTDCVDCGLCYNCCPGKAFQFGKLKGNAVKWDDSIGPYTGFIYSKSTDEKLCKNGASGGTVSAIFKYLLEKKLVDKVVCVKKENENFNVILTDNPEELYNTQGSKYITIPLNTALREIIKNKYRVAVVGTSCQLEGIYKAGEALPVINQLIKYKIGLFCGFVQTSAAITAIRNYMNVEETDWEFNGWRCGEYPGYVHFTNKHTGQQKSLIIYEAYNIAIPFYSTERCFMCPDGTNMCADISLGDVHSRGNNQNCGIVRTAIGEKLINDMVNDGYLLVKELSLEDAMKSTVGSVAYLKGMRALLYIKTNKKAVPEYDIKFEPEKYKKFLALQNRVQAGYYRLLRKKCVLKFCEKHPALQMKVGRYAYMYPAYSPIFKVFKIIKKILKGN